MEDGNNDLDGFEKGPLTAIELRSIRRMLADYAYQRRVRRTLKIYAYTIGATASAFAAAMTVYREFIARMPK